MDTIEVKEILETEIDKKIEAYRTGMWAEFKDQKLERETFIDIALNLNSYLKINANTKSHTLDEWIGVYRGSNPTMSKYLAEMYLRQWFRNDKLAVEVFKVVGVQVTGSSGEEITLGCDSSS